MVDKTSSVLSEIEAAGAEFALAKQTQFLAIGELFCIYLKAKVSPDLKAEIETAFKGLLNSDCPQKCKTLSGMIGWIAFPKSKQRVSDFHKICVSAPTETKSPEQLSTWIEENGGLRATLISHSNRREQASGSGASKLVRSLGAALSNLETDASNRRTSSSNPTSHKLNEGQKLFQVTAYRNGEYVVFEAVFDGEQVTFPAAAKTQSVAQKVPSFEALVGEAKSVAIKHNEPAATTA